MALFTTATGQKARAAWQKKYQRTFEERIWSKIKKGEPDECWLWTGARSRYGMMRNREGKGSPAHREVWKLVNGPIPPKIEVCHSCDTPACCNVKHLFLGTHQENMQDAIKKGRFVIPVNRHLGEQCHNHLLTERDVVKIRRIYAKGKISIRKLAPQFGVNHSTISGVLKRRTWQHVL